MVLCTCVIKGALCNPSSSTAVGMCTDSQQIYATVFEPIQIGSTLVLTCIMAASTGFFLVVALASGWAIGKVFGFAMLGL